MSSKCGECKYWFVEGQFRWHEGYWYCDKIKRYKVDPFQDSCKYFEEKEKL